MEVLGFVVAFFFFNGFSPDKPRKTAKCLRFPNENPHLIPVSIQGLTLPHPTGETGISQTLCNLLDQTQPLLLSLPSLPDPCSTAKIPVRSQALHAPGKAFTPCPTLLSSHTQLLSTKSFPLPPSQFYGLLAPLLIINIDFTACAIIPV